MAKKEKRYNDTNIEEIPEVAAYHEVKARYEAFRQANPQFFEYLDELQEEYNQKAEAAEKVVRAREISCGDFVLFRYVTKYDPEELMQGIGRETFLRVGGREVTKTTLEVDKDQVELAITRGDIPQDVAEKVKRKAPYFHKPSKIELP